MQVCLRNHKEVLIRKADGADAPALVNYFAGLAPETTRCYGPHGFDLKSVQAVLDSYPYNRCYIALDLQGHVVAYAVLRQGAIAEDSLRLQAYGIQSDPMLDCTYAPSVADAWQSSGLGSQMYAFLEADLRQAGFKRIILWGGVQATNLRARNFYTKYGFQFLGAFEHNGINHDMIRHLE